MSRTRSRPSGEATSSTAPKNTVKDADPDFLALTPRQQRLIDRTFARATRTRPSGDEPARKKRRLTPPIDDDMGGFMDDGEGEGGFMDAGGFLPDDIDDNEAGGGGFLPDDNEGDGEGGFTADADADAGADAEPKRIPLRSLPAILSSLNLPSDEDVLAVFRASASGWTPSDPRDRYRDKEADEEAMMIGGGVELKDFRAVCAALMGPDEGEDQDENDEDNDEDEDTYQDDQGGDESSLSEITEDEYQDPDQPAPDSRTKGKGKGTAKGKGNGSGRGRSGKGKKANLEEKGPIKLNSRQREVVNDLWGMLKPDSETGGRGSHILGRDEVRNKVRDLGEMWTEDEITDMITLFSTQYQGRGLSYDDFGAIMVRAGLA